MAVATFFATQALLTQASSRRCQRYSNTVQLNCSNSVTTVKDVNHHNIVIHKCSKHQIIKYNHFFVMVTLQISSDHILHPHLHVILQSVAEHYYSIMPEAKTPMRKCHRVQKHKINVTTSMMDSLNAFLAG